MERSEQPSTKAKAARCPVPAEQVPIREYEDMRVSWFYSWGTRTLRGYLTPVIVLWLLSWVAVAPMAAVSFSPTRQLPYFLISGGIGCLVIPLLTLVQLYVGWRHVGERLRQSEVPYEESGWYDGQVWVKPEDVANRDRLLAEYQVSPIIRRLQKTFGIMAGLTFLSALGWQLF
ncbi:MAG: CGLD27 family protein [Cyanobacteria bacterium P01_A01_bin.105]